MILDGLENKIEKLKNFQNLECGKYANFENELDDIKENFKTPKNENMILKKYQN